MSERMAHITKREFEDLMEGIGAQVTRIKELEAVNKYDAAFIKATDDDNKRLRKRITALERNLKLCNESCGEWADLNESLQAKLDAVKSFTKHVDWCDYWDAYANPYPAKCNCGLDKAIGEQK